jgi:two-component system, NarL family, response regulator NreC
MIHLIILDDHEIFSRGLQLLLEEENDIKVGCTVANANQLLQEIKENNYDVLLLDVQMPDTEPEELLQKIREINPAAKVIYLTMMRGTRFIHRLMKHNIQGYILKDAPVKELVLAIRKVHEGGTYYTDAINVVDDGEEVKQTIIINDAKIEQILSKREVEVLKLICNEYTNSDIAKKLFLSVDTVNSHRKNIFLKLGVNNTAGMVKYALQHKLLQ